MCLESSQRQEIVDLMHSGLELSLRTCAQSDRRCILRIFSSIWWLQIFIYPQSLLYQLSILSSLGSIEVPGRGDNCLVLVLDKINLPFFV